MTGLEPVTPCLQSRCSSQLSYIPERASEERLSEPHHSLCPGSSVASATAISGLRGAVG